MKKNKLFVLMTTMALGAFIAGCATEKGTEESSVAQTTETSQVEQETSALDILTGTNWQGTRVYDAEGNDLTAENQEFISLAKFDKETGFYEFFDQKSGETKEDAGTFFVTNDDQKRILISETKGYQAVVDITEITEDIFTYKRMGKDTDGNEVEVFVEHIPYGASELEFTDGRATMDAETGTIDTDVDGDELLGETLWNGTKVVDKDGNDVTEANQQFISLAKFNGTTNKYEFFDLETGETRGDFGYYDVLFNNKIRAHASIGENKYGAVLELTEFNDERFTYKRMGQDADGNEIEIFVEHEPYAGEFTPEFTF
ncbi:DUF4822 domain-containing protein [Enterococcus saccharolyticus]|uniref:DUF4822 domain-containing protein n=1 Tax=Enterococcus saccharolyticus TaxID=41997 RepID=UPI001E2A13B1|nr:DUF4822 domain-containing protein [Enterococcus saccharolyticus]MCD5003490.1 DUF4822 domain-containing protein [Enterococcus saccharolyticus]